MTPLRTEWPAGLPSPEALQTAIDALSRRYIRAETARHPVVVDRARELALLLSAYGLVPTEPPLVPAQFAIPVGRTLRVSVQFMEAIQEGLGRE